MAKRRWYARLRRAERASYRGGTSARWHLLICILEDRRVDNRWAVEHLAGGYTPNAANPDHRQNEVRRVLDELGEMYGLGPCPRPATADDSGIEKVVADIDHVATDDDESRLNSLGGPRQPERSNLRARPLSAAPVETCRAGLWRARTARR
jgi:hypothetical protein